MNKDPIKKLNDVNEIVIMERMRNLHSKIDENSKFSLFYTLFSKP